MSARFETEVLQKLAERFDGEKISMINVKKNNGIAMRGMILSTPGRKSSPVVYMEEFENAVDGGDKTIEDVIDMIAEIFESDHAFRYEEVAMTLVRETILENVEYKLVNKEANAGMLADLPYVQMEDLVGVYRIIVEDTVEGIASFIATNQMLDAYEIERQELDDAARKNTKEKEQFVVKKIGAVMASMLGEPEDMADEIGNLSMYVMTNKRYMNGATILLYKEYMEQVANQLNDDLYILPSSIHEVLAIPAECFEPEDLRILVEEVNCDFLTTEEKLSDNVYRYSRDTKEFCIVRK